MRVNFFIIHWEVEERPVDWADWKTAYELLTNSDKPIREISALTGFRRLSDFIVEFRLRFGRAPGSLRR